MHGILCESESVSDIHGTYGPCLRSRRRTHAAQRALSRSALALVAILVAIGCTSNATIEEDWLDLFNGFDLEGWVPKISGSPTGQDPMDTFRVVDGLLTVSYDGYNGFGDRFGHLFLEQPFSDYRLSLEYRFTGDQLDGGPGWAFRNSGVMFHSQSPSSMSVDQDFPISVEFQFLGGRGDGSSRPTGSVCTPGTEVSVDGTRAESHCVEANGATFDGDQWVRADLIVLGDSVVVHIVNGDTVLQYSELIVGGGNVSGYEPRAKSDGSRLASGYIAVQSESHPVQFRRIRLLNLRGCTEPSDPNFRAYFRVSDSSACRAGN